MAAPLSDRTITHIGLIVKDIEASLDAWVKATGVERPQVSMTGTQEETHATYKGKPTSARAKLAFMNFGSVRVELIEPVGKPSSWGDFLKRKGEGVQHFGITVKDANKDAAEFAKLGMNIIHHGEFPGGSYTYLDTEKQLGVILELIQTGG